MDRALIKWLQCLELSNSIRVPQRDISDGCSVAELLTRFYPQYAHYLKIFPETSFSSKRKNWSRIMRCCKMIGFKEIDEKLCDEIVKMNAHAVYLFLHSLHAFLTASHDFSSKKVQKATNPSLAVFHSTSNSRLSRSILNDTYDTMDQIILAPYSFTRPTGVSLLRSACSPLDGNVDTARLREKRMKLLYEHHVASRLIQKLGIKGHLQGPFSKSNSEVVNLEIPKKKSPLQSVFAQKKLICPKDLSNISNPDMSCHYLSQNNISPDSEVSNSLQSVLDKIVEDALYPFQQIQEEINYYCSKEHQDAGSMAKFLFTYRRFPRYIRETLWEALDSSVSIVCAILNKDPGKFSYFIWMFDGLYEPEDLGNGLSNSMQEIVMNGEHLLDLFLDRISQEISDSTHSFTKVWLRDVYFSTEKNNKKINHDSPEPCGIECLICLLITIGQFFSNRLNGLSNSVLTIIRMTFIVPFIEDMLSRRLSRDPAMVQLLARLFEAFLGWKDRFEATRQLVLHFFSVGSKSSTRLSSHQYDVVRCQWSLCLYHLFFLLIMKQYFGERKETFSGAKIMALEALCLRVGFFNMSLSQSKARTLGLGFCLIGLLGMLFSAVNDDTTKNSSQYMSLSQFNPKKLNKEQLVFLYQVLSSWIHYLPLIFEDASIIQLSTEGRLLLLQNLMLLLHIVRQLEDVNMSEFFPNVSAVDQSLSTPPTEVLVGQATENKSQCLYVQWKPVQDLIPSLVTPLANCFMALQYAPASAHVIATSILGSSLPFEELPEICIAWLRRLVSHPMEFRHIIICGEVLPAYLNLPSYVSQIIPSFHHAQLYASYIFPRSLFKRWDHVKVLSTMMLIADEISPPDIIHLLWIIITDLKEKKESQEVNNWYMSTCNLTSLVMIDHVLSIFKASITSHAVPVIYRQANYSSSTSNTDERKVAIGMLSAEIIRSSFYLLNQHAVDCEITTGSSTFPNEIWNWWVSY